mgnify:FL=1
MKHFHPLRRTTTKMNTTTELNKVYKANQCCDTSDLEYAINEVKRIARRYGWTPALRARLASLEKANKP